MFILIQLLLFSLLLGQLASFSLVPGVTLYGHDFVIAVIVLRGILSGSFKQVIRKAALTKPIVVFFIIGIISLLARIGQLDITLIIKSSLYLFRWLGYSSVYFWVLSIGLNNRQWMKYMSIAGVIFAVIGLFQFFYYPDLRNLWYLGWDPHYYRVFSTLLDPNFTGILLVIFLFVGLLPGAGKKFLPVIPGSLVVFLALLLTYSRSSYLALFTGIIFWIGLQKKWKFGLFLILVMLLSVVYLPHKGNDALSLDRYDSTVARFGNWMESGAMIIERPLLGFGFNTLSFAKAREALPSHAGAGIDNSFLFVGVTTGLTGLAAYGWLLISLFRLGKRTFQTKKTKDIGLVFCSMLGAVTVHSFFNNSLFYPHIMIILWIWIGVVENELSSVTSDR